jgi:hypothetical protein
LFKVVTESSCDRHWSRPENSLVERQKTDHNSSRSGDNIARVGGILFHAGQMSFGYLKKFIVFRQRRESCSDVRCARVPGI